MIERRPLSRLAQYALAEAQREAEARVQHILALAGEADGIRPEEGWQFDPQRAEWVRAGPEAPTASPPATREPAVAGEHAEYPSVP